MRGEPWGWQMKLTLELAPGPDVDPFVHLCTLGLDLCQSSIKLNEGEVTVRR